MSAVPRPLARGQRLLPLTVRGLSPWEACHIFQEVIYEIHKTNNPLPKGQEGLKGVLLWDLCEGSTWDVFLWAQ